MRRQVYCISGLGADERIFSRLQWQDCDLHHLSWIVPGKQETLEAYAARMCEQIKHEHPVLIGVSFGGMMCIEIAKIIQADRVILISSIKTKDELPAWLKLVRVLNLHRVIPILSRQSFSSLKILEPIENYFLGADHEAEKQLAMEFRRNIDPAYLRWSVDRILNWNNRWVPPGVLHIHGTSDRIFPLSSVHASHTVRGAGHFMVYSHASEVSNTLNQLM
jgi:pimeloyl-ACP methyl ester carboxylesterase